jgi:hypothetical protein
MLAALEASPARTVLGLPSNRSILILATTI